MNMQLLKKTCIFFGLAAPVSLERAVQGLGNENYFVSTEDRKKYVIKILRTQSVDGLENEIAVQKQLKKAGLTTPEYLVGKNKKIYFEYQTIFLTCTKFIQGKPTLQVSDKFCKELGKTLAEFYSRVKYLPAQTDFWLSKNNAVKEISLLPNTLLGKKIKERVQKNLNIFDFNLPKGVIHGDLHLGNLIVTPNNKIVIFDFEDVDENVLLLDISITAVALLQKRPENGVVKNLLLGYENIRQLTALEKVCLPIAFNYVSGASAAWLLNKGYVDLAEEMIAFDNKFI